MGSKMNNNTKIWITTTQEVTITNTITKTKVMKITMSNIEDSKDTSSKIPILTQKRYTVLIWTLSICLSSLTGWANPSLINTKTKRTRTDCHVFWPKKQASNKYSKRISKAG